MPRSFLTALRRANRLMRPAKASRAARSIHAAVTNLMVQTAMAPLTAIKPAKARRRKAVLPRAGGTVSPRVPAAAQFLSRRHRSPAGSRDYKLYLPASHPKRPCGMILMLHGCSQTPDDFAVGTNMNALAEKHGLAIAYPGQRRGHNAASCWNWFLPAHQRRGSGEPAILASLTRKLMREFGLDRGAVFVAGLSSGGAMAATLADLFPDLYAAAGIHSGLAYGSASNVQAAMSVMRNGPASTTPVLAMVARDVVVRRIVFQGTDDTTVHPSNSTAIVAAVEGTAAVPARISKRSSGGRGYVRSDYFGPDGTTMTEHWMIEGAGHAWSGGRAAGTYTDRLGPDASVQMVRFFLATSS